MNVIAKIFSIPLVKFTWYKLRRVFSSSKPKVLDPENLRHLVWGTASKPECRNPTPKIMWSYWNGKPSPSAEACRKTWSEHQSDFTIHVLSKDTVKDFLPDFPNLPHGLPEQKVSNLIRLMLLERYGGIWVDYSTVLTCSLDWATEMLNASDCEMLAFYNEFPDEYATNHKRPIIENGFLAARPNSRFVSDWKQTYQECIQSCDYKEYFRSRDDFEELTSNFLRKDKDYIDYFVCYIAAQHVMLDPEPFRLLLMNSEDEYYYYSYSMNPPRSRRKFAEELLIRSYNGDAKSRMIKMTGRHRMAVDEHIQYGCYRHDSIIGRYLTKTSSA